MPLRRDTATRLARCSLCAALALSLGSCAAVLGRTSTGEPGPAFPAKPVQTEALNVHVFREGRSIVLTNTTARPLGPGRLWLNRWWSAPVEAIPIGATVSIPLSRFRDEFGWGVPGGGFFAAVAPEKIVLAELETEQGLTSLVVIAESP